MSSTPKKQCILKRQSEEDPLQWAWCHTHLYIPALRKQRQVDLGDFKAGQVYIELPPSWSYLVRLKQACSWEVVAPAFNSSTQEAGTGESEFKVNLVTCPGLEKHLLVYILSSSAEILSKNK